MAKPDGCTYPNCFICPLADCSLASAKAELPGETKKKRRIVRHGKRSKRIHTCPCRMGTD